MKLDLILNAVHRGRTSTKEAPEKTKGAPATPFEEQLSMAVHQPRPETVKVPVKTATAPPASDATPSATPKSGPVLQAEPERQSKPLETVSPVEADPVAAELVAQVIKSLRALGIEVAPEKLADPQFVAKLNATLQNILTQAAVEPQRLDPAEVAEVFDKLPAETRPGLFKFFEGLEKKTAELLKALAPVDEKQPAKLPVMEAQTNDQAPAEAVETEFAKVSAGTPETEKLAPEKPAAGEPETHKKATAKPETPAVPSDKLPVKVAASTPENSALKTETLEPETLTPESEKPIPASVKLEKIVPAFVASVQVSVKMVKPKHVKNDLPESEIKVTPEGKTVPRTDKAPLLTATPPVMNPETTVDLKTAPVQKSAATPELPVQADKKAESASPELLEKPATPLSAFKSALAEIRLHSPELRPAVMPSAEGGLPRPELPLAERSPAEKQVMHQILSKLHLFHGNQAAEIRLQLKPEHLGIVKISLDIEKNIVLGKMQVESENVKHIVETNFPQLKSALEESGIKVEKFEVFVNNGRDDFFRRELSDRGRRLRNALRGQGHSRDGALEGVGDDLPRRKPVYEYSTLEWTA